MNYEVVEALGQIAREKNVDKKLVIETLEAGLQSAAKKKYGATANFVVEVDEKQGNLGVFQIKRVVDEVLDPAAEINLREAHETHPDASVGDDVRFERPFAEFGRNAIMAAKQVVVQRVREAEREQVYADFQGRVGDIITGTVQQVDRGNYFVNLGRTEALLPIREQISRERYRQGETLRAVLLDVQKNTKGPQVILSRTHPMFLQKLFEIEVPEIKEKIVEIKAIAREPGLRSKIAVVSHEEKVDPVGACVGMKGSRVQAVVRELNGERIDIVPWASDSKVFVARALAPAKIQTIELNEAEKGMTVIVADDQLSLAIGKKGQNARLAAKLVGWKIDLVCESERKKVVEQQELLVSIEELPGVGDKLAKNLLSEGIETIQDLSKMTIEQLVAVPGIGDKTAEKLLETAKQFLAALRTELDRKRFETEEDTDDSDSLDEEETVLSPDDEVVTDEMVAAATRRRTEVVDEDAEASPPAELIDELEEVVPREIPEARMEPPVAEDGEILSAEERARRGAAEPEGGAHAE
jgi:transcription termination/antitermination protein NusA